MVGRGGSGVRPFYRRGSAGARERIDRAYSRTGLIAPAVVAVLLTAGLVLALATRRPASGLIDVLESRGALIAAGSVAAACAIAFVRAYCYRRLVGLPGPMQVHGLANATGSKDVLIDGLDVYFRQRLSNLKLNAPTPTPDAKPTADLITLLRHPRSIPGSSRWRRSGRSFGCSDRRTRMRSRRVSLSARNGRPTAWRWSSFCCRGAQLRSKPTGASHGKSTDARRDRHRRAGRPA